MCAHGGVRAPAGKNTVSPLHCLPPFVCATKEEEGAAEVLPQHLSIEISGIRCKQTCSREAIYREAEISSSRATVMASPSAWNMLECSIEIKQVISFGTEQTTYYILRSHKWSRSDFLT
jgi:hypothetical protein